MTTNIDRSEWEDLDEELRRSKRSRDEFEFSETVEPLPAGGIHPLRGTIRVRHRNSGIAREYATGHGSIWVTQFSDDLASGVFG